jgi:hypothetical protein
MMTGPITPVVRNLIVCEEITTDPSNANRVSLMNLIHSIRSLEVPPYPLLYRQLCVYVQLTGCRGPGKVRLAIQQADTDEAVLLTPTWAAQFLNDPLSLHGLRFRIRDCRFPAPGLYWIQFWYNNTVLSQQPIMLR